MYMRACPADSLLRENESSVRDLPLVKQNFIIRDFIMFHDALSSPKEKDFLSGILSSLTIIFRLSVGKKWVHKCLKCVGYFVHFCGFNVRHDMAI